MLPYCFSLNGLLCCVGCLDVFKHAKIVRWHNCSAHNCKTMKANYMLMKLLCAYKMIKSGCKILISNFKGLLRKMYIRGIVLVAPCRSVVCMSGVCSVPAPKLKRKKSTRIPRLAKSQKRCHVTRVRPGTSWEFNWSKVNVTRPINVGTENVTFLATNKAIDISNFDSVSTYEPCPSFWIHLHSRFGHFLTA